MNTEIKDNTATAVATPCMSSALNMVDHQLTRAERNLEVTLQALGVEFLGRERCNAQFLLGQAEELTRAASYCAYLAEQVMTALGVTHDGSERPQ